MHTGCLRLNQKALDFGVTFQRRFIGRPRPKPWGPAANRTMNIQRVDERRSEENFMRLAIAPIMSAGVIIANINDT